MPASGPGQELTALDWIAAVLAAGAAVMAVIASSVYGPAFRGMYAELGPTPGFTDVVLSPMYGISVAVVVGLLLALGLARRTAGLGLRRALIVTSFFAGSAAVVVFFWGAYQPLFEVAGAIR